MDSFVRREKIRVSLTKKNIESRPLGKPMHMQPLFKNYTSYENGISTKIFKHGLCLPSGSSITEKDLQRIVQTLKNF